MKLGKYQQQPRERESYTIRYDQDLTAGDGVNASEVTVDPPGLTIDTVQTFPDRVRFWATGGVANTAYKITVLATTDDGRQLEDEVIIKIKDD